eukprot:8193193-Alexandrium_andersonii.AAC.1
MHEGALPALLACALVPGDADTPDNFSATLARRALAAGCGRACALARSRASRLARRAAARRRAPSLAWLARPAERSERW